MTQRRQLAYFFAVSFSWAWLVWALRFILQARGVELGLEKELFSILAPLGPGVAALVLARRESREAFLDLWHRGWRIETGTHWLWWALLGVVSIAVVSALLSTLVEPIEWQYALSLAMVVPIAASIYLFGALPEEYGWRGYALPRLLARFSPPVATLILGLIWGVWHIPLHFILGTTQSAMPIYQVVLSNMAIAFQLTWIYQRTHGSVMAAALLHATGNVSLALLPFWVAAPGRWIYFGIIGALALVMSVTGGRLSLRSVDEVRIDDGNA